jgi:NADPH-dependent 2,4-dienoyl-CoA reductase/sulfur reductase-like enzyme
MAVTQAPLGQVEEMVMQNGVPRGGGAELDCGKFDETYDVIVVGYGFAGGITAIEAADAGAKVLGRFGALRL